MQLKLRNKEKNIKTEEFVQKIKKLKNKIKAILRKVQKKNKVVYKIEA